MVSKMPKDRNPWLADDMLPDSKTVEVVSRVTLVALIVIVILGLFAFVGA